MSKDSSDKKNLAAAPLSGKEGKQPAKPAIGFLAALLAIPAFIALQVCAFTIFALFSEVFTLETAIANSNIINAVSLIFAGLVSLLPLIYIIYRWGWKYLGFNKTTAKQLLSALLYFALYFAMSALAYTLIGLFFPSVNLEEAQELGFDNAQNLVSLALTFISLVIITPVVEELYFRGLVYKGLRPTIGVWPAALLSGIAFGLVHFQLNIAIDTAILGVLSAILFERTGTIWPSITLHVIKNMIAFALVFVVGL